MIRLARAGRVSEKGGGENLFVFSFLPGSRRSRTGVGKKGGGGGECVQGQIIHVLCHARKVRRRGGGERGGLKTSWLGFAVP